ncbi:5' nucleotidase, NT5C type [Rhizosphaericola mali]|uniref:Uncharacterized protein n=1 Tax=Rhizosphaericola mali TaxID=2545455 RepID=A0A5P2GDG2_9BACT|nr:hypothetical protein [Rhizosphaericola mali]QES89641.1 hypothetical protein E0W69_013535 [Rhizosphaericola mali]
MSSKKILYLDMDGVLADYSAHALEELNEIEHLDNVENNELVKEWIRDKNRHFYAQLPLVKDALKSVEILSEHYELYVLSTPMWTLPESYSDKRIWIEEKFGNLLKKKLILTHNKGLLKGDYLIDDRKVHGVSKFEGEHIWFGQAPFENWNAILQYLSEKDHWQLN